MTIETNDLRLLAEAALEDRTPDRRHADAFRRTVTPAMLLGLLEAIERRGSIEAMSDTEDPVIAAAEADAAATRLIYLSKRLARELTPEQRQAARVLAAKMGVEMSDEAARELVARMAKKL